MMHDDEGAASRCAHRAAALGVGHAPRPPSLACGSPLILVDAVAASDDSRRGAAGRRQQAGLSARPARRIRRRTDVALRDFGP